MKYSLNTIAAIENCKPEEVESNNNCLTAIPNVAADSSAIQTALSVTFSTIAAIAVIIIILQAIKFVLSSGEPEKAANARKGIIYALVGLVLALSANFLVLFILQDVF